MGKIVNEDTYTVGSEDKDQKLTIRHFHNKEEATTYRDDQEEKGLLTTLIRPFKTLLSGREE